MGKVPSGRSLRPRSREVGGTRAESKARPGTPGYSAPDRWECRDTVGSDESDEDLGVTPTLEPGGPLTDDDLQRIDAY
jgi:hypothetical protein